MNINERMDNHGALETILISKQEMVRVARICHHIALIILENTTPYTTEKEWDNLTVATKTIDLTTIKRILEGVINSPEEMFKSISNRRKLLGWTYGQFDLENKKSPTIIEWDELTKYKRLTMTLSFNMIKTQTNFTTITL